MPHIPIPPKPTMTMQQKIQTIQSISGQSQTAPPPAGVNIYQPNSNVAQQIKDVAEQQARMVLDEWLKNNKGLFQQDTNKLKIRNIHKLIGMAYDERLSVMGVLETDKYYEFSLNSDKLNMAETILLHRRQTDSGHYIMEYKTKTLWLTKDEIDMPEKLIICMNTI